MSCCFVSGTLQDFTTEEQQVRGRSISPQVKWEEDGALGPPGTDTKFTQSPDWLRERPETNQSPSSNQTQSCRQDAGPQPAVNKQEVPSVKQEVDEGYTMPEAAVRAQISCQQEGQYSNRGFYSACWLLSVYFMYFPSVCVFLKKCL